MQNFHWNLLLLAIWIGFSPEYERLQSKQRENLSSENAVRKIVHERTKITGWHPSYCLSKFRMKQEAKAPNEFWGRTNIKRVPGTGSLGCWTAWPLEWDCAGPQSLWSLAWRFSQEFTNTLRSQSAEDWKVGKRYWPWGDEVLDGNNPILQRLRTVMWHRSPRGLSGRPWRPEQHCCQRHWAWKDFIRT